MGLLSERQQRARAIADELQAQGATITSALPLEDGQPLRFWVDDYKKKRALQALADAGYAPIFLGMTPQVDTASYKMSLVNSFLVELPAERQVVHDSQTIRGEIAKPEKTDVEREGMRRYLGLDFKEKKSK
jgi:hypothetical protein